MAGQVYPAIRERRAGALIRGRGNRQVWRDGKVIWHYDESSAQSALETAIQEGERSLPWGFFRNLPDEITRHFRETKSKSWTDWMIENRIVTGRVCIKHNADNKRGSLVHGNISNLKDFEFYRVLDPATIHMEISNYIGGVLPGQNKIIELTDTDKIRKAGFDTRTSFRQDPGIKKPRRRNKSI